jgi:hypothetical protein
MTRAITLRAPCVVRLDDASASALPRHAGVQCGRVGSLAEGMRVLRRLRGVSGNAREGPMTDRM